MIIRSNSVPSINGHLHYPNHVDRSLTHWMRLSLTKYEHTTQTIIIVPITLIIVPITSLWLLLIVRSTRLTYTGLLGGLEHLKIGTRLIDEMFASVMGDYVFLKWRWPVKVKVNISRWTCKNKRHTNSLCNLPDVLTITGIIVSVIFSNLVSVRLIKWPIYISRVMYVSIKTWVRVTSETVVDDEEVQDQRHRTPGR
jgi:hypothetical protein